MNPDIKTESHVSCIILMLFVLIQFSSIFNLLISCYWLLGDSIIVSALVTFIQELLTFLQYTFR